jgi:hypothetical protein
MLGPQHEIHVGHALPSLQFGAGGVGELDAAMNQAQLVRVKGLSGGGHGEENQLSSCSPSNAAKSLMLRVTSTRPWVAAIAAI